MVLTRSEEQNSLELEWSEEASKRTFQTVFLSLSDRRKAQERAGEG